VLGPLGFTVFVALSGPESLEVAARCHPDLVLLDLTMPGMTGWEVAERLRAEQHDELAILIVSADAHILSGGRQGPVHHDDYLVKPLQLPELFDKLQLLLDVEWILEAGEASANQDADGVPVSG
jgi:CheY-like chemotaxis protein